MSRLTACVACLWLGGLAAQEPGSFVWRELASADAIAVGLVWERGFLGDVMADLPSSSGVIAELRRARASARVKHLLACTVHVDAHVTAIIGVVPAAHEREAVEFLRALLDDQAPVTDDEFAQVVARRALAADDAEHIVPGDLLTRRALLAFRTGAPHVGSSTEIAGLPCAALLERLRSTVPVTGAVAGAVSPWLRQAVGELPLPVIDANPDYSSKIFGGPGPGGSDSEVHSRLDQPFVMAAFRAPDKAQLPAFAVAVEVARARAAKRFRFGGSELRAHAPFVAWSWAAGDPCVRFFRRGREPRRLAKGEAFEADAAAEAAATWSQLAEFLDDLRHRPPSAAEVAVARQTLLTELGLVVAADRPISEGVLPGWLLVQLLAKRRGIDASAIAAVEPAAAHAVLTAAIENEKGCYHELLPLPRADRTWPRR